MDKVCETHGEWLNLAIKLGKMAEINEKRQQWI